MHAEPGVASAMLSQQIAGHRVEILATDGEWVRMRGADGYEGWMHIGYLARTPDSSTRQSRQSARMSLGCVTRTPDGQRRALPLRALLAPDEIAQSGETIDTSRVAERFPPDPAAIARTAQEFFAGTSYVWGGVTPWGADCSGIVQTVFALHGTQLPRDAWQQALAGVDIETDISKLLIGDLAFFSDRDDRRITHVGIALGGCRMVHLGLGRGGYNIERLDDTSDPYVVTLRARMICARRLIS
jgi:cell wall-associated NlpC family hydrolase